MRINNYIAGALADGVAIRKSRRDNTLLTVCFSLRSEHTHHRLSPAGTTLYISRRLWFCRKLKHTLKKVSSLVRKLKQSLNKVSSLRDFLIATPYRKLKHTVKKMSSLRDFFCVSQLLVLSS